MQKNATSAQKHNLLSKADKHLHLLLSAPHEAYQKLSAQKIPELSRTPYHSCANFFETIRKHYVPVLNTAENIATIVRAALEQMIADSVTYAEASLPLPLPRRLGMSWQEFAAIIKPELDRVADQIEIRLEAGHAREVPFDFCAELELAAKTKLFSGLDLYGDELSRDIAEFADFFAVARANNLYVKLHTGEFGDAARMRRDIELVNPDEIQHGIAAAADPKLMGALRERRIPLNICPTSNVMLGVVQNYAQHPVRTLVENGVIVTLGSDDFAMFGVSLSLEYDKLLKEGVLSASQLESIRLNSLQLRA